MALPDEARSGDAAFHLAVQEAWVRRFAAGEPEDDQLCGTFFVTIRGRVLVDDPKVQVDGPGVSRALLEWANRNGGVFGVMTMAYPYARAFITGRPAEGEPPGDLALAVEFSLHQNWIAMRGEEYVLTELGREQLIEPRAAGARQSEDKQVQRD